jgi:predicted O-methyltransferase YrrM
VHRAVDYLVSDKEIDAERIAVVGHSRMGKAALVAAAFDDRIALAIPHQAGCGGTAPSRGKVGESVKQINDRFPHWFDAEFKAFNDHPDRLPFDQHSLVALVAPRPVLFTNAVEDTWANPEGQFAVLVAADPVYRLLGVEGIATKTMPETNHLIDSRLGYHIRPGKHSMGREDWKVFLAFADKHLKNSGSAARSDRVDAVIAGVDRACRDRTVYMIGPEKARRLAELVRTKRPMHVVECGTAIGYSGLWIARELKAAGRGRLTTIEIDPARAREAAENFRNAGLSDVVEIKVGDARQVVKTLDGPFDFAFIDCNFDNYAPCFAGLEDKLADGATIVADNVGVGAKAMADYLARVRTYPSKTEWFDMDLPWGKRDAMEVTTYRRAKT